MKVFSYFHNRKTKRYTVYYTIVLTVVMSTVVYTTVEQVNQGPVQSILTFYEGFFSLFMLSRSEQVERSFMSHLSLVKAAIINPRPLP